MKRWVKKAIHHAGALHRALGVPEDVKIPGKLLRRAAKHAGRIGREARLALEMRRFRHHA